MLSIFLNLCYQSFLLTVLIVLLMAGGSVVKNLWFVIFHPFAIYANPVLKLVAFLYHFVLLAAIVFFVIAILHLLTGGGTNAH